MAIRVYTGIIDFSKRYSCAIRFLLPVLYRITVLHVCVGWDFAHLSLRCAYCASMCMWRSAQPTGSPVILSALYTICTVSVGDTERCTFVTERYQERKKSLTVSFSLS